MTSNNDHTICIIMSVICYGRRVNLELRRLTELGFLAEEPTEYLAVVLVWADTGKVIAEYSAPDIRAQRELGIKHMVELAMHPEPLPTVDGPMDVLGVLAHAASAIL